MLVCKDTNFIEVRESPCRYCKEKHLKFLLRQYLYFGFPQFFFNYSHKTSICFYVQLFYDLSRNGIVIKKTPVANENH